MHAEANAYYWIAGVHDLNEQRNGGNGMLARTSDECLDILASHLMVSREVARKIALRVKLQPTKKERLLELGYIIDDLRPQWKAAADAAISEYGLTVFGDKWPD